MCQRWGCDSENNHSPSGDLSNLEVTWWGYLKKMPLFRKNTLFLTLAKIPLLTFFGGLRTAWLFRQGNSSKLFT